MKTSAAGLALIERFEGLRLKAYQDGNGVWTIGFGHTGPKIHAGTYETREEAEADLVADVSGAEAAIGRLVKVPLDQSQFDALVSFTFNEGPGRLASSTLLAQLNRGNYPAAAAGFRDWVMIDHHLSYGLLARREMEMRLFLGQALPEFGGNPA